MFVYCVFIDRYAIQAVDYMNRKYTIHTFKLNILKSVIHHKYITRLLQEVLFSTFFLKLGLYNMDILILV